MRFRREAWLAIEMKENVEYLIVLDHLKFKISVLIFKKSHPGLGKLVRMPFCKTVFNLFKWLGFKKKKEKTFSSGFEKLIGSLFPLSLLHIESLQQLRI